MEIISAVEPFGLDERRSLYKVEYSVAAKIILIYIYAYVCTFMCSLFVELNLSPLDYYIYILLLLLNKMPLNVFLTPAIKIIPRSIKS